MNIKVLFTLMILFSFVAKADLSSMFYKGKIEYAGGTKQDVEVYVNTFVKNNITYQYGLIISKEGASVYKINEFSDASFDWLNIFQGTDNLLKMEMSSSELQGRYIKDQVLKLISQDNRFTVVAEKAEGSYWSFFPDEEKNFEFGKNMNGRLTGDIYNGDILFKDASYNGSFHLNKILPFLAVVRAVKPSRLTIEEWSLDRNILGVVLILNKKVWFSGNTEELIFIKLPAGENNFLYSIARGYDKFKSNFSLDEEQRNN